MRRSVVVAVAVFAVLAVTTVAAPATARAATRAPVSVAAAFYPLAYAAQTVGGRHVAVTNLTPSGVEPHDLELTTKERDTIDGARVVLVMGNRFQPAVEKAAGQRGSGTVEVLKNLPIGARGNKAAAEGAAAPDASDPHVWLDPSLMRAIVADVTGALVRADRGHAADYRANAAALDAKLAALDQRYRDGLASCTRHVIVTSHEAFGYLAAAYGLRQKGITKLAPEQKPDPKRLAQLADLVKRDGVTTVFTEDFVSPKIAQTLAREAGGVRTEVLSPLEGLTSAETKARDDYLSVMDRNLAKLRKALDCR